MADLCDHHRMPDKNAPEIATPDGQLSSENIDKRYRDASEEMVGNDPQTDAVECAVKEPLLPPHGASNPPEIVEYPSLSGPSSRACNTQLSHTTVSDHHLTVSDRSGISVGNCSTRLSLFEVAHVEPLKYDRRHGFE